MYGVNHYKRTLTGYLARLNLNATNQKGRNKMDTELILMLKTCLVFVVILGLPILWKTFLGKDDKK